MKKDKKWIDPKHLNLTQKILAALGFSVFLILVVIFVFQLFPTTNHGLIKITLTPLPSPIVNFIPPANIPRLVGGEDDVTAITPIYSGPSFDTIFKLL